MSDDLKVGFWAELLPQSLEVLLKRLADFCPIEDGHWLYHEYHEVESFSGPKTWARTSPVHSRLNLQSLELRRAQGAPRLQPKICRKGPPSW